MIERELRIKLALGESLLRRDKWNRPENELKSGMAMIIEAGFHISGKNYLGVLEPLFEGLGWVYLSGLTGMDAYKIAVTLAGQYLDKIASDTKKERVVGWRMSMDQIDCYSEIAGLTLDAPHVEVAEGLLKKVDLFSQWSTWGRTF